jgi:hypothetical protein
LVQTTKENLMGVRAMAFTAGDQPELSSALESNAGGWSAILFLDFVDGVLLTRKQSARHAFCHTADREDLADFPEAQIVKKVAWPGV